MPITLLPLALIALPASSATIAPPVNATAHAIVRPFTIDQIFGSRPVVAATVNGKPYRLVIHANAGSYLQINHAEAQAVGARDLVHKGAYGISAPGQVSDLGRDDGFVDALAIGGWSAASVPVAVFEVPAGGSQGMLGLPFLHDNKVVLDFDRRTVTLPGAMPADTIAATMKARGYAPHPMIRDAQDGRYLVTVAVNGESALMVVSTVASVDLDTDFARRAGVAIGTVSGNYGGPSGATGRVYDTAAPISFSIGDWRSAPSKVSIQDSYAYSKAPRPTDPALARGGALGADFMISSRAVIDFGNRILYLKAR